MTLLSLTGNASSLNPSIAILETKLMNLVLLVLLSLIIRIEKPNNTEDQKETQKPDCKKHDNIFYGVHEIPSLVGKLARGNFTPSHLSVLHKRQELLCARITKVKRHVRPCAPTTVLLYHVIQFSDSARSNLIPQIAHRFLIMVMLNIFIATVTHCYASMASCHLIPLIAAIESETIHKKNPTPA
jgi:hypothetical protein